MLWDVVAVDVARVRAVVLILAPELDCFLYDKWLR